MNEFEEKEYSAEAKEKWGNTGAYREYTEKTRRYTKEKWNVAAEAMMGIFAEFAACMNGGNKPDSADAQALAAKLQSHITENYYNCTREILSGLGQMYVCDARFRKNIDKYGEGTAQFVADAIAVYCGKSAE